MLTIIATTTRVPVKEDDAYGPETRMGEGIGYGKYESLDRNRCQERDTGTHRGPFLLEKPVVEAVQGH
jgi:hypothetical protein